jgi:hypothetical protein
MTEISSQTRFQTLTQLLLEYQALWRFDAFQLSVKEALPWAANRPELCRWLDGLTPDQIEAYKAEPSLLAEAVTTYTPELTALHQLISLPVRSLSGLRLPRGLDSGIPGRKMQQILAMSESSLQQHLGSEWLEWCAGKGYLGRLLAQQSGQAVTSLEWQQALCDAGQLEADKRELPMRFVQGDALAPDCRMLFNPRQHAVALHACGDLHISLLKQVVAQSLPAVTFSPCCYHLIQGDSYQPLSYSGANSGLELSKSELRIPLQETVTGGERVKRHRRLEMSYRLGLDLLLRHETEDQGYITIPSIKKSQLADGFEAFCHWAIEQKGLVLPQADFAHWQRQGEKRFWQMERLSLMQQLFRRPLEIWLVLDRALYLEQHGYKVTMSEFCPRSATPRNILVHAERP